jgi:hypothetical protein
MITITRTYLAKLALAKFMIELSLASIELCAPSLRQQLCATGGNGVSVLCLGAMPRPVIYIDATARRPGHGGHMGGGTRELGVWEEDYTITKRIRIKCWR